MSLLTSRGRLPTSDRFLDYSPQMQFVCVRWVAPLCHICLLGVLLTAHCGTGGKSGIQSPYLDLVHCG